MEAVAAHSRVHEWVGQTVRAVAEPDKARFLPEPKLARAGFRFSPTTLGVWTPRPAN